MTLSSKPVLEDEVAIVTGASRGLGRAIAQELASAGAAVIVNYREREADARTVVDQIVQLGGKAFPCQGDVTREVDVRRMTEFTIRQCGKIDVLVCNAGIVRDQLIAAMNLKEWEDVIETHLRGTFLCVRDVLPGMLSRKHGSIVTMSSIAATRGGRGHANYAAAKGGIESMTRALAVELAPKRIRVNAVAPGVMVTDMTQRIRDVAEEKILQNIPLKRYGQSEEVARAVRFLASAEASYITGVILPVTGGMGV
jgi:3-oxoacyl-[acyl-carrier protein] reductase